MKKTLPPLAWFRAFEAAARRLSFTAAAAEIGMTQSAVSQQIRALESRLGVMLFVRQARGLALTDEARKLLPQVEAALGTLIAATEQFDAHPGGNSLVISASISVTEWLIAPALPQFRAHHPGLSLRFLSAIWPDEFATQRADVEIRFGTRKQAGDAAEAFLTNTLMAVKAPHLKGDLPELPLIATVGISSGWKDWGAAAGVPHLAPTLFVDSYGLALQLAAQGNGVALVTAGLAQDALRTGALVAAHHATIPGIEGYFLSVTNAAPAAETFATWLRALALGAMPPRH